MIPEERKYRGCCQVTAKTANSCKVLNLQPDLPGLAQGQSRRRGPWVAQLVFLFRSRKSPLFFHGATPEVNYLQSGRPPVSVTICLSNALLPEPPLKGPLVEDQPSSEVDEKARKNWRRKKLTRAIQFIFWFPVRQVDWWTHPPPEQMVVTGPIILRAHHPHRRP